MLHIPNQCEKFGGLFSLNITIYKKEDNFVQFNPSFNVWFSKNTAIYDINHSRPNSGRREKINFKFSFSHFFVVFQKVLKACENKNLSQFLFLI